jgi:hypothetical protein
LRVFLPVPFLALAMFGSCHPTTPAPAGPIPVRWNDLVAAYRQDEPKADLAFTGHEVVVLLTAFVPRDCEVHCHDLGNEPPVLVLTFPDPPEIRPPCWVRGVCQGRQGGRVAVTGCRPVLPPTKSMP